MIAKEEVDEYERGRSLSIDESIKIEESSFAEIWNALLQKDTTSDSPTLYSKESTRSLPVSSGDRSFFDNPIKKLIEERANEFGIAVLQELKVMIPLMIWNSFSLEQTERIKADCVRFCICIGQIFIDSDNRLKHRRNLGFIINTMEFEGAIAILRAQNQAKNLLKDAMKSALHSVLGNGFSALLGV
jgi:hypothetical protein